MWLVDQEKVIRSDVFKRFPALLSQEEHEKWLAIRAERKRQQFLIARGALRIILCQYIPDSEPEKLNIAIDPFGKPVLKNAAHLGIEFNISHAKGKIVLGIASNKRIGVDIEYMNPNRNWEEIARQYFHPSEWRNSRSGLLTLSEFYKLWTLKEAFLKAEGRGMTVALNNFYFDNRSASAPKLVVDKSCSDFDGVISWSFSHQYLDDNYSLAIGLEGSAEPFKDSILVRDFLCLATTYSMKT